MLPTCHLVLCLWYSLNHRAKRHWMVEFPDILFCKLYWPRDLIQTDSLVNVGMDLFRAARNCKTNYFVSLSWQDADAVTFMQYLTTWTTLLSLTWPCLFLFWFCVVASLGCNGMNVAECWMKYHRKYFKIMCNVTCSTPQCRGPNCPEEYRSKEERRAAKATERQEMEEEKMSNQNKGGNGKQIHSE